MCIYFKPRKFNKKGQFYIYSKPTRFIRKPSCVFFCHIFCHFLLSQKFRKLWWIDFFQKLYSKWLLLAQISQQRHSNNNYKNLLAKFNIWSQNLGQKSKCSKFVISTKSENVNFNYLPPLWAHKPKHFLLWKFFSNSKNLVRMGPKNVLFVFLTILCESKMSADVINRFFFKNDIQSGSDWNKYHNKDLKLINISIYWHLITF